MKEIAVRTAQTQETGTSLFGLPGSSNGWSASFSKPSSILTARNLDEVIPLLHRAEKAALAGNYVALLLCYEAAPVFDPAFLTHSASTLPLAWAAVFPAISEAGLPFHVGSYSAGEWSTQISRSTYDTAIDRIRELIAEGQTYQVNFSIPLNSVFSGDSLTWYHDLCLAQGAQFSAFLDIGDYQILSFSPELFFERNGSVVRARPMKGTIKRGRWFAEDQTLASWLATSSKDRAENVMIVDLLRNDLGKVSVNGSVSVKSLFDIERFETVWQMTSTVESILKPGIGLVDLMRALFPCGSITGAPKIRTMEIIRELEPTARGVYTGTIGLLRPGGECTFNVAIRTVVLNTRTGEATFGVGGGITIGSTAQGEYDECLAKARFLDTKPKAFNLFESILLEDDEYFLLDMHLQRLRDSATYFAFEFPETEITAKLEALRYVHREGSWKVKVTLSKDGSVSLACSGLAPLYDSASVNDRFQILGLSRSAVDSSDCYLFHKTTLRDFYNCELRARPECDDVLFYNERGEVTESTIANVVVDLDGKLVTPPIVAGLLAGTFRNALISNGEIEEQTIKIEDLKRASQIFLINSVRKWMGATMSDEL
jgi:para-aminobenzoate synthetase / 4-amino-4-deoxychorismate lyase